MVLRTVQTCIVTNKWLPTAGTQGSPAVTVPTSPEGTELAQCPQVPTSGHSASVPVNMCVGGGAWLKLL